jgi:hypothetical protein
VNSKARTINSVSISGKNVLLTLSSPVSSGDAVTVSYTKPATNPVQTASGGQAASIIAQNVTNNVKATPPPIVNQVPTVTISNPSKGNTYIHPTDIEIVVIATDPDGTISKVELFNGTVKLAELSTAPYSFTWKGVSEGTYQLKAVATDNLNAPSNASLVEFTVEEGAKYDVDSDIINLYPNPNSGNFNIEFLDPAKTGKSEIIISDLGGKQIYHETISTEEITRQFNLQNIRSGIYIMTVINQEILVTKKIIIR